MRQGFFNGCSYALKPYTSKPKPPTIHFAIHLMVHTIQRTTPLRFAEGLSVGCLVCSSLNTSASNPEERTMDLPIGIGDDISSVEHLDRAAIPLREVLAGEYVRELLDLLKGDISIGLARTTHCTPSVHGGVVSEPSYRNDSRQYGGVGGRRRRRTRSTDAFLPFTAPAGRPRSSAVGGARHPP